jgi:apolipoprotein N-acyltransferase
LPITQDDFSLAKLRPVAQAVSSVVVPSGRWSRVTARARLEAPTLHEWAFTGVSTGLLILSFPNFESYLLAWICLVPLLLAIARRPSPLRALIMGWAMGTVFFYVSCYWLTYSMIHYGGLPTVVAYLLLIPGAVVVGIFPGLFAWVLALAIRRWGPIALVLAPICWPALEWARLGVTGQLWNALGYSQAYNHLLIQAATWGGVYAVSFIIVIVNSAIALLLVKRDKWTITAAAAMITYVLLAIPLSYYLSDADYRGSRFDSLAPPSVYVVSVQPNVPMTAVKTPDEIRELLERHFTLSNSGLQVSRDLPGSILVVWPESPMNFTYASDKALQERLANFTRDNRVSLLFNSLEPAPSDGGYNSALLINEEGRLISQYDKIRLMPFGEYVPLPHWLPGASLITGLVGEFTPGSNYTLMPIGRDGARAGVFICIESAYPWIARTMTRNGADFLVNISNDGYLGPTAVMRQHLANAIFRAVENHRPVLRVTNTGLSAKIDEEGRFTDVTPAFATDVRVWTVPSESTEITVYTKFGDFFAQACAAITLLVLGLLWFRSRRSSKDLG